MLIFSKKQSKPKAESAAIEKEVKTIILENELVDITGIFRETIRLDKGLSIARINGKIARIRKKIISLFFLIFVKKARTKGIIPTKLVHSA